MKNTILQQYFKGGDDRKLKKIKREKRRKKHLKMIKTKSKESRNILLTKRKIGSRVKL